MTPGPLSKILDEKPMTAMTTDETLTLMMALISQTPIGSREIAQGLDCSLMSAHKIACDLKVAGGLQAVRNGVWRISEKGRIACALSMHKDPSLCAAFFD
jgi:hypothetical protein